MSEYVPFKYSWPWFHKALRTFVPEVMSQLEPGAEFKRFELKRGERTWRLAPVICYEGTFARVCRRMVVREGRKDADILVNLSNDGWFVWRWGPWTGEGTAEHAQHLAHYCFRAVENRVPVVRAVNTGISASIDSNGRIVGAVSRDGGRAPMLTGTLLLKSPVDGPAGARAPATSPAGPASEIPQVLVDGRVSLYSIVGDVFVQAVCLVAVAWVVWTLVAGRMRTRPGAAEEARR
jgi:apolipoprotein N-acyltransferase